MGCGGPRSAVATIRKQIKLVVRRLIIKIFRGNSAGNSII